METKIVNNKNDLKSKGKTKNTFELNDSENIIPKSKLFRKDKPWDNDPTIDKFKIREFKKGDMKSSLLEESSFALLFP